MRKRNWQSVYKTRMKIGKKIAIPFLIEKFTAHFPPGEISLMPFDNPKVKVFSWKAHSICFVLVLQKLSSSETNACKAVLQNRYPIWLYENSLNKNLLEKAPRPFYFFTLDREKGVCIYDQKITFTKNRALLRSGPLTVTISNLFFEKNSPFFKGDLHDRLTKDPAWNDLFEEDPCFFGIRAIFTKKSLSYIGSALYSLLLKKLAR